MVGRFFSFLECWWLNQPIWKKNSSHWIISPGRVENKKNWSRHPVLEWRICKWSGVVGNGFRVSNLKDSPRSYSGPFTTKSYSPSGRLAAWMEKSSPWNPPSFGMAKTEKNKPPPMAPLPMPAQHQGPGGIPPTANSGDEKTGAAVVNTPKNAWKTSQRFTLTPKKLTWNLKKNALLEKRRNIYKLSIFGFHVRFLGVKNGILVL